MKNLRLQQQLLDSPKGAMIAEVMVLGSEGYRRTRKAIGKRTRSQRSKRNTSSSFRKRKMNSKSSQSTTI